MSNAFSPEKLIARANVSRRYAQADLCQFPKYFRNFGESGESLFVVGPRGTGKTHFLCACVNLAVRQRAKNGGIDEIVVPGKLPIQFLPVPELMLEFKQSYDRSTHFTEADVLEKYSRMEFLALDDLGAERVSDWSIQMLYLLIDRRYREMKRTLISTNLSLGKISGTLDDRIASRIAEMCQRVRFEGRDRRIGKQPLLKEVKSADPTRA